MRRCIAACFLRCETIHDKNISMFDGLFASNSQKAEGPWPTTYECDVTNRGRVGGLLLWCADAPPSESRFLWVCGEKRGDLVA